MGPAEFVALFQSILDAIPMSFRTNIPQLFWPKWRRIKALARCTLGGGSSPSTRLGGGGGLGRLAHEHRASARCWWMDVCCLRQGTRSE